MSRATIERFYKAFASLDAKAMAECYAQDATFEDEVFNLRGRTHIGGMWGMLCHNVRRKGRADWKLEVSHITDTSAHWEPTYRFLQTGAIVHNVIDASFEFDSKGLIKRHRDRFDFWRWSRQALGLPGLLFGWTGWMRSKVQRAATRSLAQHLAVSADKYTAV